MLNTMSYCKYYIPILNIFFNCSYGEHMYKRNAW